MRSYQVHIPSNPEELSGLVGAVVKYTGSKVSEDFLLYEVGDSAIELICQGNCFSHPTGPTNEIISIRVDLSDLTYEFNGLTTTRTATGMSKETFRRYSPGDQKYNPREQALGPSGLWTEPSTE